MGILHVQDLWMTGTLWSKDQITQLIGSYAELDFKYNALVDAVPNTWKAQMKNSMSWFGIKIDV